MALVCRVLSVAKRGLSPQFVVISSISHRLFSDKQSSSDPLLTRLLREPNSRIKSTLDSEDNFSLNTFEFSWEDLIARLRSSSPEKAHLVLEWRLEKMLKEDERDHNRYSNLISLCGKFQNVPLAMRVFTSMEVHGIKPTTNVFNSLVHTCLSSGNVATALSLFEIMDNSEGFKPNPDTYENFISAFSNSGNADAMHIWYLAKKAAGFSANLQTYESLISGSVKLRDFDSAGRFYEEMILSGVTPNTPILEYMLEGLCKRRSSDQVKVFLNSLLDSGWEINVSMAEKLVGFYFELGNVEELEQLLATLTNSNQASEVLLQVHSGIIRMYAMSDRLDDVEYSVGRMLIQGLSFKCPDDVEKVISLYFRQAAYDRLDLFLEHIKDSYKLTKSIYNLLVAGYRRAGLNEKLDLVMRDMEMAGFS